MSRGDGNGPNDKKTSVESVERAGKMATRTPVMMRIAIAGTGGLAQVFARVLHEETSHQFVLLSRSQQPHLQLQGYQIQVVNYDDATSVQHALLGVDLVLSTINGEAQLKLIDAAVHNRVRRFIPSEFEGTTGQREIPDTLRPDSATARGRLAYYQGFIESTIFSCGLLYEHFGPEGLAAFGMGFSTGSASTCSFIADINNGAMIVPAWDYSNNPSALCLTSARDVARFVIAAFDLDRWPAEMTMSGERMTAMALCSQIQEMTGRVYNTTYEYAANLSYQVTNTPVSALTPRLLALQATASGRYDFATPYLNQLFPHVRPESFRSWFLRHWGRL